MNAYRTSLHEKLGAASKRLTASPLFPWLQMVAYVHFAAFSIGLFSERPFEVGRITWFGWIAGPTFLLNAVIVAARLFNKPGAASLR